MNRQNPFEGLICPMVTPLDKHGYIDLITTKKLVDHLIGRGVNGLLPCGTTGEGMLLTLEERKNIAQTVVEQAAGRLTA